MRRAVSLAATAIVFVLAVACAGRASSTSILEVRLGPPVARLGQDATIAVSGMAGRSLEARLPGSDGHRGEAAGVEVASPRWSHLARRSPRSGPPGRLSGRAPRRFGRNSVPPAPFVPAGPRARHARAARVRRSGRRRPLVGSRRSARERRRAETVASLRVGRTRPAAPSAVRRRVQRVRPSRRRRLARHVRHRVSLTNPAAPWRLLEATVEP